MRVRRWVPGWCLSAGDRGFGQTNIRLNLASTRRQMRVAFLVGAIFALSVAAFAQTAGQITGQVTDTSDAIVVGATVTVTNSQTNVVRTITTNSAGDYTFSAIPPGVYNVKTEMPG